MQDTWEDQPEQQPGWTPEAPAWYGRRIESQLRSFLLDQPAYMEALGAASPNQRDPYRDGLERVTDWYLRRRPMVEWTDDPIYRPETLGGGWKLLPGAIRGALMRAVRDVLEEIAAEREAGERQDQRRTAALLKAEWTGTLGAAPPEPSKSVLLARQAIRGGWVENGGKP